MYIYIYIYIYICLLLFVFVFTPWGLPPPRAKINIKYRPKAKYVIKFRHLITFWNPKTSHKETPPSIACRPFQNIPESRVYLGI